MIFTTIKLRNYDEFKNYVREYKNYARDCEGLSCVWPSPNKNLNMSNANSIPPEKLIDVRRIIKNGKATIVFWNDHTKTVVLRKEGEEDDIYHAFCSALAKKIFGNNSQIKKIISQVEYPEQRKV